MAYLLVKSMLKVCVTQSVLLSNCFLLFFSFSFTFFFFFFFAQLKMNQTTLFRFTSTQHVILTEIEKRVGIDKQK